MLIVPALEYEKQRQQPADWNKVILHREGKFYRTYQWSLWLIKTFVCTEEFQKQRGDDKMLSAKRYVGKKTGEYAMSGFPVESLSKYIPEYQAVRRLRQNVDGLKGSNPAKLYRSINSMLGVMSHFDAHRLSRELFCVEPFLKHGYFADDMTCYYLHR